MANCDSIMDISLQLNLDDISALAAEDMEFSVAQAPLPEDVMTPTKLSDETPSSQDFSHLVTSFAPRKQFSKLISDERLPSLKKFLASNPDVKSITQQSRENIQASKIKQKMLEVELAAAEARLEAKKKLQSEEEIKIKATADENKTLEGKMKEAQLRVQALEKEMINLKLQKASTDKENDNDKGKVDLYRQLTGVTFAKFNVNAPTQLKGYVSAPGNSSTDLKNFTFDTSEHSVTLIRDFIWQFLQDIHKPSWGKVGKLASSQ